MITLLHGSTDRCDLLDQETANADLSALLRLERRGAVKWRDCTVWC